MARWLILILMVLVMVPLVHGGDICEQKLTPGQNCLMLTPSLSCGEYTYTLYNETNFIRNQTLTQLNSSIYYFNFNESEGDYIVELCDGSTREIIVEGDDDMGSIAITLFILFVSGGLIALPFIKKQFTKNPFSDIILKRCCWIVGIYLMMLNSAIMATIADYAGLALTDEMFRYMWLFGIAGYLLMFFLVIKTLFDLLRMWKIKKFNDRMGGELF